MESYNGFYKVGENNGGVCVGYFFNPDTKESFSKITWDIDRPYINDYEEIEILRYLPINEDVKKIWKRHNEILQEGDRIEVYKGRKVPKGTIAVITAIKPFYDKYHRWQCDYAYLDNGMKTNILNCKYA